jgi:hypothetical protein
MNKNGNPNIKSHGVKFGSGQSRSGSGRKKNIYTVLSEMNYSKDDITAIFLEVPFYNYDQIVAAANDTTKPIIINIIAKSLLNAYELNDYRIIKEIIEQVTGKATQRNQIESKTPVINFIVAQAATDMTNDEID